MNIIKKVFINIVIRTLNERKYLYELLNKISKQNLPNNYFYEVTIVDSGSTDDTLLIAKSFECNIVHIKKSQFSFGRSLNFGCNFKKCDYLVIISGHCIPYNNFWLINLINPLVEKKCDYVYGKQIGRDTTRFSEQQVFSKFFNNKSSIPQNNYFCNNANAAITYKVWKKYKFNEDLTGCEDKDLAKKLISNNFKIGYISNSIVFHIHNEKWSQIATRYEREAIAHHTITPNLTFNFIDFILFYFASLVHDIKEALKRGVFLRYFCEIILYRFFQYYGTYKGFNVSKKITKEMTNKFFYPKD